MGNNYVSLLTTSGNSNYVSLLSSAKGGESAGTVARGVNSNYSNAVYTFGGESAGTVACSSGSSCCSSSGSFSAIA